MARFDYMCRECGEEFDEPHRYTEMHGFTYGPGEEWAVCPNCGSCDWAEASVVEAELDEVDEDDLLEDSGWVDEEVDEVDTLSV